MVIIEDILLFFASPLSYFISISGFVGKVLVEICMTVFQLISLTISLAFEIYEVCWSDYLVFVVDAYSSCHDAVQWFVSRLLGTANACQDAAASMLGVLIVIGNELIAPFKLIPHVIGGVVGTLKTGSEILFGALEFIGLSVLWTIFTLPVLIVTQIIEAPRLSYNAALRYSLNLYEFIGESFNESVGQLFKSSRSLSLHRTAAYISGALFTYLGIVYGSVILNLIGRAARSFFVILSGIIMQCWSGEFFESRESLQPFQHNENEEIVVNENNEVPLCIVCLSEPKNVLFLPCRHVPVCRNCANLLPSSVCPLCRKRVRRTMQVFV